MADLYSEIGDLISFISVADEGYGFPVEGPLSITLPTHTIQVRNIHEAIAALETVYTWLDDQDVQHSAQLANIRDCVVRYRENCPSPTAMSVVWSGKNAPASFGVSATGKGKTGSTSKSQNNDLRGATMGPHGNFTAVEPWPVTNCAEVDSTLGRVPGANLVWTERIRPRQGSVDVQNMNDQAQQRWFAQEEAQRRFGSAGAYGMPACGNCQKLLQSYGSCSACGACPSKVDDVYSLDNGLLPPLY
ncbi:hypothetical protein GLAREA_02936 [Glarea lozoyensis ATCC 20868]|uniref:Uncharacterized protein n=1 Tax=Glarea lozoyensis (strain ATCC 20868 / MF5171) TaxID=1116229 RepID=S3CKG6_GLAL2|nr:uncharacterized protein GLAREA_02936 [Glarea lozoyensis ATCC 20868]EPE27022.1 hypothetical protein GLAREA_02936 [Glarea lozoyensis ATCC 20868]